MTFENREALKAAIKDRDWKGDLRRLHDEQPDFGLLTAVYASVGSSTFRAFRRRKDWGPSIVFRSWACSELLHSRFDMLEEIDSNDQYREWARSCARSLRKHWKERLGYAIDLKALKLINLLAKSLCVVSPLWPERYDTVIWHIDIPLDQYSSRPLSCLHIADLNIKLKTASMGTVKDIQTYSKIEDAVRSLCAEAGAPAIAYDFLAWDSQHPPKKAEGPTRSTHGP